MAPLSRALATIGLSSRPAKRLGELVDLLGQSSDGKLSSRTSSQPPVHITCASADALAARRRFG